MRKISSYILIPIILVGVLSSVTLVRAQSTGYCNISVITTESACIQGGGKWTSSTPPTGTCFVLSNPSNPPTTSVGCIQAGGTWTSNNPTSSPETSTTYHFLAPIGGVQDFNYGESTSLASYVNLIIKILIGLAAVLAVIMIILGGIQYMGSELISSKEEGKKKITNALIGLVVALGAYLLLFTINPNLLNVNPQIAGTTLAYTPITPTEIIANRSGTGICAPVNDPSKECYPTKLASAFTGTSTSATPFDTIAAQASAICYLESDSIASTLSGVDKCADGKAFSFGLFQINA